MGWIFWDFASSRTGEREHALEHLWRALDIGTGIVPDLEQALHFHEVLLRTRLGLFDQAMSRFMPIGRRGVKNQTLVAGIGLTVLHRALLPNEAPDAQQASIAAAGQTAIS